MERTLEDERRGQAEKIRMMTEKMEDELKVQRAEADKAIQCKLQEHKELQEKGFREKAELMNQEIQILKEKNSQSAKSGNFLTNALLPIFSMGLQTVSTVYQNKAFKKSLFPQKNGF
ncbi:hypothetical protein SKAU_G00416820 [Synaphobranchus kaupii]|uniref:Guanylate-binding protein/Atlastin C-terminal domain-containing protein n=1 Tax=Synaphobranchus kaupii TaxID=118154 RepID=A0A9Q1E5T7_SYNKA|nr:hypothetical protein SKAU_G00416820 [Synaphobranchus kaupii]